LAQRTKFTSTQSWFDFLNSGIQLTPADLIAFRLKCYEEIEALRGRPLLVYVSQALGALPGAPVSIDVTDIDGFTDLVNSVPTDKTAVDVLIHSPGGSPDATERIVSILRNRFTEVHFLVPHSAYSAATMMALSGNSITLHPSATLGPIDPQLSDPQYGYVPARSIKRGFEKVRDIIKTEGPEALPAYIPLIEKYSLHLLELCDDSENLSKRLVTDWLKAYMFNGIANADEQINTIVDFFSAYDTHLTHSRPLVFGKIKDFGLTLSVADGELKDLLWEVYILINGFFTLTPFVKLFENRYGISWGRSYSLSVQPQAPASQQNVGDGTPKIG
jgi:hypothetical protein